MTKTCPECGDTFDCTPNGECWCSTKFMPPAPINKIHNECLCPACIREAIASKPPKHMSHGDLMEHLETEEWREDCERRERLKNPSPEALKLLNKKAKKK